MDDELADAPPTFYVGASYRNTNWDREITVTSKSWDGIHYTHNGGSGFFGSLNSAGFAMTHPPVQEGMRFEIEGLLLTIDVVIRNGLGYWEFHHRDNNGNRGVSLWLDDDPYGTNHQWLAPLPEEPADGLARPGAGEAWQVGDMVHHPHYKPDSELRIEEINLDGTALLAKPGDPLVGPMVKDLADCEPVAPVPPLAEPGEPAVIRQADGLADHQAASYLGLESFPDGFGQPYYVEANRHWLLCWSTIHSEPSICWMPRDEVHKHYGAGYEPLLVSGSDTPAPSPLPRGWREALDAALECNYPRATKHGIVIAIELLEELEAEQPPVRGGE